MFKEVFETERDLGMDNSVVFTDFMSDEALPALYQGADLFVFPLPL